MIPQILSKMCRVKRLMILSQKQLIYRHWKLDIPDSDKLIVLEFDKKQLDRISQLEISPYPYKVGVCENFHIYVREDLVFKEGDHYLCWRCGELVLTEWENDIIEVQAGEVLEELKDICKECDIDE